MYIWCLIHALLHYHPSIYHPSMFFFRFSCLDFVSCCLLSEWGMWVETIPAVEVTLIPLPTSWLQSDRIRSQQHLFTRPINICSACPSGPLIEVNPYSGSGKLNWGAGSVLGETGSGTPLITDRTAGKRWFRKLVPRVLHCFSFLQQVKWCIYFLLPSGFDSCVTYCIIWFKWHQQAHVVSLAEVLANE